MSAAIALTERDFMRQVTELAELLGWQWAHFRPAQTTKGWRTPVSGPLGKGWPDLVLTHAGRRRLIFAELKRDGAYPTPEQRAVIEHLAELATDSPHGPHVEVHVWRPRDWDDIERTLR